MNQLKIVDNKMLAIILLLFLCLSFGAYSVDLDDYESPPKDLPKESYVLLKNFDSAIEGHVLKNGIKYIVSGNVDIPIHKDGSLIEKAVKPVLGYNEKGVYLFDKLVCSWTKDEKTKLNKLLCPDGFPIEMKSRIPEKNDKNQDKLEIKLFIVDSPHKYIDSYGQRGTTIFYQGKSRSIFGYMTNHFKFIGKDVKEKQTKRFIDKNPEILERLEELIKCFEKEPFCMGRKELDQTHVIISVPNFFKESSEGCVDIKTERQAYHCQILAFFQTIKHNPLEYAIIEGSTWFHFKAYTGDMPFICNYFQVTLKKEPVRDGTSKWRLSTFGLGELNTEKWCK